jgi:Cys-rich protein (TIGR01571 family)
MSLDFKESLFGCFTDICSCFVGTFVPCGCMILQTIAVTKVTGDNFIVPYCMPVLLGCIGSTINRGEIRQNLGLAENFCADFAQTSCCLPFTSCQEYREVKFHWDGKPRTV